MSDPLIIGTNGTVLSIEPTTGEVRWSTALKAGGFFSSPKYQDVSVLIKDDVIFAGTMGYLFCLSLATGEILWHNELKGMGFNDISLAIKGVSVQYLTKVESSSSSSSS